MKPISIRRFEFWFATAVALYVASAVLGWGRLSQKAEAIGATIGETSQSLGALLILSSIAMFIVAAALIWGAIAISRLRLTVWLLAALIAYAAYTSVIALSKGQLSLAIVVDVLATLAASVSVAFLFRKDAQRWLAGESDQPSDSI